MIIEGTVRGGVVVLAPGAQLADGTLVRVEPIVAKNSSTISSDEDLARMGELAVETGIPDLATNADHYLYGHPKVSNAR